MSAVVASKKLTRKEKEELLKKVLGSRYSNVGNNFPVFNAIIDGISITDNAFS